MENGANHMNSRLHIVMFPWLAFGHMIPFLKLSKCLAAKGHKITFLSTPRNIERLEQQQQQQSSSLGLITFVKLPPLSLPHHLPPNAEATTDLSPDEVEYLKKAFDEGIQEPLANFLDQANSPKPDWIIRDFIQHWTPSISSNFGIRTAYFSVFPATALGFCGPPSDMMAGNERSRKSPEEFTISPDWINFPSQVYFRLHEAEWFANAYLPNISGVSDMYRFGATVQKCDAVFIRTCHEYESQWIHLLQNLYQKPVIPVGMLPLDQHPTITTKEETTAAEATTTTTTVSGPSSSSLVFEWLDGHKEPGRVLYVALGSEGTLSLDLVRELALGLEDSQVPFLWALRRPIGLGLDADLLPKGFEDRIKGRGLVTIGFAPQLEILSHCSVGGFLTHAGWSSTVEGMQTGRPLILLSIFVDQGLNTRVMVQKKVGVELPRDHKDGTFSRFGVAQVVRKVMIDEKESFTSNAKEMQKVFADVELHDGYINDFVNFLKENK